MAGNSGYWKDRMADLEDQQYQNSAAYYKDIQDQFRQASNNIQMDIEKWYQRLADNNEISYASARKFLKESELREFKWDVKRYIKAGEENAVDQRWMKELENASARYHISYLEAMKLQTRQHAELLSTQFDGGMTDFLHKSYADQYYRTAFEITKGTGVGRNLARMDSRQVDMVIRKPWAQDGKDFSDRIWTNKEKLVNSLHTELTQSIIRGSDPRQAINNLAKTMNVSRSQAGTLIMTESAAIASAAQKDCFKELGVEEYEVLETLDGSTCDICQEMDGKVFKMSEYEVGMTAPPFHPRCRGCTVPHFDDEFSDEGQRAARGEDGKTYFVPSNMKYQEWEKQFVKASEKANLVNVPDNLKPIGALTKPMEELYYKEVSMMPENHRKLIEDTLKEVRVDPDGNSRYDRSKGILYLSNELDGGEVIHEMAHALETKMGVWSDPEFVNAVKKTLGEDNQLFYVIDDADTFVRPIQRLDREDILVSAYQGRIYEEIGAADENWEFNYNSLGDFFSEAYREYVINPDVLKEKQPLIFSYIERIK